MNDEVPKKNGAANGKEGNVVVIGKEWPPCPSCATPCKPKDMRCLSCGHDLTPGGAGAASCFSEQELAERLRSLSLRKKLMTLFFVICLAVAAVAVISLFKWLLVVLIIAAIAAVVFWILSWSAGAQIVHMLKVNIVRTALSGVFAECEYAPTGHVAGSDIRAAGLIDGWDVSSGNDHVRGKYKGHSIEFSDVHLEKESTYTDNDGNEHSKYKTIFKGQWMTCKLNRTLDSMVRVREKAGLWGFAKNKLGVRAKGSIETENDAFNHQFEILSSDPHTAFYVLTPHFMEYITAADRQANGRTFLCFSGDTVHIAVHNGRDSFEVRGRGSEIKNLPALRQRMQREIKYITSILYELLQNDRLFAQAAKCADVRMNF